MLLLCHSTTLIVALKSNYDFRFSLEFIHHESNSIHLRIRTNINCHLHSPSKEISFAYVHSDYIGDVCYIG